MSLKGTAMTDKVLRGKIKDIRQIEDVNALYAEAEELIASANEVIKTEEVVAAAREATAEAEEAAASASEVRDSAIEATETANAASFKANKATEEAKEATNKANNATAEAEEIIARMEEMLARMQGANRIAYIDLLSANWQGEDSPYSQVVAIDGVTENSKIDLNPSIKQLDIFHEKDISFVAENENGEVTVFCIGQKPLQDYKMQITITEVITNG